MLSDDSTNWLFGLTSLSLAIAFLGQLKNGRLNEPQRLARRRKFALIGLAVWFFFLPVFKPYMSSYSWVENVARVETEKQATIEGINDVNAAQSKNIEELREEVIRLRNDLSRANDYYSTAMRFVSMLIVIFCTYQVFQKKDSDISTND